MARLSPADFMDWKYPGWENRIDFPTVDMEHAATCIIGQASGDSRAWSECAQHAGNEVDFFSYEYQGTLLAPFAGGRPDDPYRELRLQYWREEVAKRKLAKLPATAPEPGEPVVA